MGSDTAKQKLRDRCNRILEGLDRLEENRKLLYASILSDDGLPADDKRLLYAPISPDERLLADDPVYEKAPEALREAMRKRKAPEGMDLESEYARLLFTCSDIQWEGDLLVVHGSHDSLDNILGSQTPKVIVIEGDIQKTPRALECVYVNKKNVKHFGCCDSSGLYVNLGDVDCFSEYGGNISLNFGTARRFAEGTRQGTYLDTSNTAMSGVSQYVISYAERHMPSKVRSYIEELREVFSSEDIMGSIRDHFGSLESELIKKQIRNKVTELMQYE